MKSQVLHSVCDVILVRLQRKFEFDPGLGVKELTPLESRRISIQEASSGLRERVQFFW